MTRHKALHIGLVSPSPLDRLINALLHAFAMLVSHAAHLCSMRLIRPSAECHSDATPEVLPCKESGKLKETTQAAARSPSAASASSAIAPAMADRSSTAREGLMLRTIARAIVDSKHEAELTNLSTSHPRACPEDLGSRCGGTRPNPHDLPTEILGMRFAYPRMTRCWVCGEQPTAYASN